MTVIVEEAKAFESWLKSKGVNVLKCFDCGFQGPLYEWHSMDVAALVSRGVAYEGDKVGRFMNMEGKMGAPRPVITITCPKCAGMKMFNLEEIDSMKDVLERSHGLI